MNTTTMDTYNYISARATEIRKEAQSISTKVKLGASTIDLLRFSKRLKRLNKEVALLRRRNERPEIRLIVGEAS